MPDESETPDLVELVRGFAAISRADDLDAYLTLFARDAVWDAVPLGLSYHGVEEIRGFLTDWLGAYDEYRIEPQEIRDLGNGVVLAVVRQVVRPVGSTAGFFNTGSVGVRVRVDRGSRHAGRSPPRHRRCPCSR